VFAVVALAAVRWTTDWPQWSDPAVLGVLSATAWAAGRVTRSDLWALFWDCAKVVWLSGALIFGGHLLIPSDGFIEGAVVTWGSFAGLLLWRRWQVARGVRESMEAPIIGPRRQQPRG
jgi:hypothetical protein